MAGNKHEASRSIDRFPSRTTRFDLLCAERPRAGWTDEVGQTDGRIKATLERRGTRIEDFDAAIAAHALALGAALVMANLDH